MSEPASACKDRLQKFLRRDLAGWHGLPESCLADDISSWLMLRSGEGIARFGSEIIEYRFRVVAEAPGFTEPVRLYFHEGALRLVRTGLWSIDRSVCERLLRELGDPPDRLDLVFGTGIVPGGEWVYAARGLMLGVIPDSRMIANVAGYTPCTVDLYRRRYRDAEPAREFPGRRDR